MNGRIRIFSSLIVLCHLTVATNSRSESPATGGSPKKSHPCHEIKTACKAKGKGAVKRACFQDILSGKAVEGVVVDPNTLQACQQKQVLKEKRAIKKQSN